jgi:hypothetical protein
LQGDELEAQRARFSSEFCYVVLVESELIGGKVAVIEFLMRSHSVEDDA